MDSIDVKTKLFDWGMIMRGSSSKKSLCKTVYVNSNN